MKKILNAVWRVIRLFLTVVLAIIIVLVVVVLSIMAVIVAVMERIFKVCRVFVMKILAVFKDEFSKKNAPRKGRVVSLSGTVKVKSNVRHESKK